MNGTQSQKEASQMLWPLWLELAFAALIPFLLMSEFLPPAFLSSNVIGSAMNVMGDFAGKVMFYAGIPVGIVGLVNARHMIRHNRFTKILSMLNLCTGILVILAIVLVFCAVIFGRMPA